MCWVARARLDGSGLLALALLLCVGIGLVVLLEGVIPYYEEALVEVFDYSMVSVEEVEKVDSPHRKAFLRSIASKLILEDKKLFADLKPPFFFDSKTLVG